MCRGLLTTQFQLKLIRSPLQDDFIQASDVPWPSEDEATVRVVGAGAGQFTYILVSEAGHFVSTLV